MKTLSIYLLAVLVAWPQARGGRGNAPEAPQNRANRQPSAGNYIGHSPLPEDGHRADQLHSERRQLHHQR